MRKTPGAGRRRPAVPRRRHAPTRRARRRSGRGSASCPTPRSPSASSLGEPAELDELPARCEPAADLPQLVLVVSSEEHTSELQSLMRISYAVFCLKKKKTHIKY